MVKSIEPSKMKVAVLSGGSSSERDISLLSGEGAKEALVEAGFNITMLDPAMKSDLLQLLQGDFDVAFLCLHGRYGEDGTIQGFLETIGLPYTGSGVWSSALAMDKERSKSFYRANDIPCAESVTLRCGAEANPAELIEKLGNHCVVKPAAAGSALGVYIVEGERELADALEKAKSIEGPIMVEQFLSGPEYTVAVIDDGEMKALPVIEIIPQGDFYDFESKYAAGGSQHICPARLTEEQTKTLQSQAVAAHKALGCDGVSRSDFILGPDGVFSILETNTIPGMTSTSLLPDAARVAGYSFAQLCVILIKNALEKAQRA